MASDPVKPEAVEKILTGIENAANQAVRSTDPKVVPKAEKDLLRRLEALRTAMDKVMQQLNSNDASQLNECFGGDCMVAGRCRAVLETLTFEDGSPGSNSVKRCLTALEAVERVLEATGCSEVLRVAQERERKAFLDRAVKQGGDEDCADSEDAASECWDDDAEAHQFALPSFAVPAPEALEGWLLKKSPQPRLFNQFQKRWLVLEAGRLSWYGSDSDAASSQAKLRGQIDFAINPCIVSAMASSATQFSLRPAGGQWVLGSFTGAAEGREFHFDAVQSDYDRNCWVESINAHIKHAKQSFQGAARAFQAV